MNGALLEYTIAGTEVIPSNLVQVNTNAPNMLNIAEVSLNDDEKLTAYLVNHRLTERPGSERSDTIWGTMIVI